MARSTSTFQPGHAKVGGRKKGTLDRKVVARQQMASRALQALGLTVDEIDALSPLAVMKLVMASRLKSGDLADALLAAEACAPYVHAKLSSADVRVQSAVTEKNDAELAAEIAALEAKMSAAQVH